MPEAGGIKKYIQLLLDRRTAAQVERELQEALDKGTDPAQAKANVQKIKKEADELGGALKKIRNVVGGMFAGAVIGATIRQMWELGTAAEETASKFATTFGAGEAQVQDFIDKQGTLLGLNKTLAREMTATAGAIVQGMGMSKEASAGFSIQMAKAAGDLQSFHNVPIEQTFNALRAGLTGETEPLKRFGIVLQADEVYARALTDSLKNTKDELTQTEIATARLNIMLEKMGPAAGDAERTMDSSANKARKLTAEFENMKIELAAGLMPVFSDIIGALSSNPENIAAAAGIAQKAIADLVYEFRRFERDLKVIQMTWENLKSSLTLRGRVEDKNIILPQVRRGVQDLRSDNERERALEAEATAAGVVVDTGGAAPGESVADRKARIAAAKAAARTRAADAKRAAAEARREAERAEKERIRELERAAAYQMRHFAIPAMGTPNTQIQGAKDFGFAPMVDIWGDLDERSREVLGNIIANSEQAGSAIADNFSTSFELLFSNLDDLNQAFADFFGNIAAGALAAVGASANAKARESFAEALSEGALAIGALAAGNIPAASLHGKAAASHLAAGAAWSALAGGMGAGARAMGGGGGLPGGAGGRGAYDRNPGGRYASQTEAQSVTYVYVDPFNPSNPVHSRQVGKAVDLNVQLSGKPAWVR